MATIPSIKTSRRERDRAWRDWMMVAVGLLTLVTIIATIVSTFALARSGDDTAVAATPAATTHEQPAATADAAPAPTLADAKGVDVREVPAGRPHAPGRPGRRRSRSSRSTSSSTSPRSPPTSRRPRRGPTPSTARSTAAPAASPPIVVNEGDKRRDHLRQRRLEGDGRQHGRTRSTSTPPRSPRASTTSTSRPARASYDRLRRQAPRRVHVPLRHAAGPDAHRRRHGRHDGRQAAATCRRSTASCGSPRRSTTSAQPGEPADMAKMAAEKPDVIAFNGYANQYKDDPITGQPRREDPPVRPRTPDRASGAPSTSSAPSSTRTHRRGHRRPRRPDRSTSRPSQGGWVEFTLDQEGNYPFVTHAFGDMVKGAAGILHTPRTPRQVAGPDMGASAHSMRRRARPRATST